MTASNERLGHVHSVLGSVASLARVLTAEQRRPFDGKTLTGSQLSVLFFLARIPSGLTPGRLAELLDLTAGAVTQLIDGLRTAGHVEIRANPDDARSRIVTLSPQAREEVEQFETATALRLLPRLDTLTATELATLASLMIRITEERVDAAPIDAGRTDAGDEP